jgi:hypothetical protein
MIKITGSNNISLMIFLNNCLVSFLELEWKSLTEKKNTINKFEITLKNWTLSTQTWKEQ